MHLSSFGIALRAFPILDLQGSQLITVWGGSDLDWTEQESTFSDAHHHGDNSYWRKPAVCIRSLSFAKCISAALFTLYLTMSAWQQLSDRSSEENEEVFLKPPALCHCMLLIGSAPNSLAEFHYDWGSPQLLFSQCHHGKELSIYWKLVGFPRSATLWVPVICWKGCSMFQEGPDEGAYGKTILFLCCKIMWHLTAPDIPFKL